MDLLLLFLVILLVLVVIGAFSLSSFLWILVAVLIVAIVWRLLAGRP